MKSKEEQARQAEEDMINALEQLQDAARACGISMVEELCNHMREWNKTLVAKHKQMKKKLLIRYFRS